MKKTTQLKKLNREFRKACCIALLAAFALAASARADSPLQGHIEETTGNKQSYAPSEPMPIPSIPTKPPSALKSGADQTELKGQADDDDPNLEPGSTKMIPKPGHPLQAGVERDDVLLKPNDPDSEDRELMVEWDRWRNRLLFAIQSGMQEYLSDPNGDTLRWDSEHNVMTSAFRLGTVAYFKCKVTPDRHFAEVTLLHPSGYPAYDRALILAIKALDGSSLLKYPRGSHRTIVTQAAGIKTSAEHERQYIKFGDVERYRSSQ